MEHLDLMLFLLFSRLITTKRAKLPAITLLAKVLGCQCLSVILYKTREGAL